MTTTPRWLIPYPAGTNAADVPLWMHDMAVSLDDHAKDLAQSTRASRPAASKAGRYHWSTDTKQLSRDNGSSWDETSGALDIINAGGTPVAGNYSFSSIPATYRHLRIVGAGRSNDTSGNAEQLAIKFNNAAGHAVRRIGSGGIGGSDGTGITNAGLAVGALTQPTMILGALTNESGGFSVESSYVIDILNYTKATYKAVLSRGISVENNAGFDIVTHDAFGFWENTAVVNRVDVIDTSGVGFDSGSFFTLYGIR